VLAGAFVVLMAVAVTWPGAVPAARIEPRVLGLPFAFAWPALWVVLSGPMLWYVDRVERRHRASRADGADGPDGDA
jgi:hypothetical protein